MSTTETPTRDAKIVQYLGEALGNEKRLEAALQAHIGMTSRAPYKRRLREHLAETKRHGARVSRRIKQLGGTSDPIPAPLVDAAGALLGGAQKATALAQAPLHALRGTGEAERQLKNAKAEYADEAQEIGMYSAIEALAVAVADKETAQLAREILRDERRMFAFLDREIPRLTTAVARAEIPARQRNGAASGSSRKATRSRGGARGTRRTSTSSSASRRTSARGSAARRSGGRSSRSRPRPAVTAG